MKLQAPPEIEILKALSLVANGKIKTRASKEATVQINENESYDISFDSENNIIDCDDCLIKGDKMTPSILAFLMLHDVVPYDNVIATKLKGVKWENLIGLDDAIIQNLIRPWSVNDKKRLQRYVMWISEIINDLAIKTKNGEESLNDY